MSRCQDVSLLRHGFQPQPLTSDKLLAMPDPLDPLDTLDTLDVSTRVIELIARSKSLPPESVTPATTFDELNIDSLDKINLSFEVEEVFAINIPDASLNSLRTVGDVIKGVHRLQAEKLPNP